MVTKLTPQMEELDDFSTRMLRSGVDGFWLLEHLGECAACNEAHGAMLEASVGYRAWQLHDGRGERERARRGRQVTGAHVVQ